MNRIVRVVVAAAIALPLLAPVALAADPAPDTDRVLISIGGDVTVPPGDRADTVLVADGNATVQGAVGTLVVLNGTAVLEGAQAEEVWALGSDIELGPGTVVTGDVRTLDTAVLQDGDAVVLGEVTDLSGSLVAIGAVLAPAFILFWVGTALATIVAGLILAGLASRQVRDAGRLIAREPVRTFAVGLVATIGLPVLAVALLVTIIGAPLGLAVLFGVWPLLAFVGYLVAGIWIGEWLQARMGPIRVRERPYAAAVIGLLVLGLLGLVPVLSIAAAIASLFGFGAVVLLAWRTLTAPSTTTPTVALPAPVGA